jgi:hypothetical protein
MNVDDALYVHVSRRMWDDVFVVICNKCSSPSVSVANVVLRIKDVLM